MSVIKTSNLEWLVVSFSNDLGLGCIAFFCFFLFLFSFLFSFLFDRRESSCNKVCFLSKGVFAVS